MEKGIIIKGIAGFYYVEYRGIVYECKARGIFKNKKITPLVGDFVRIEILDVENFKGVIEEIYDREAELLRPAVANVNQAIIVFAAHTPEPNLNLIDKMAVLAEYSDLDIVICMNKCDLDHEKKVLEYRKIYESCGYKFVETSAINNEGVDQLKAYLVDKISVFSGPSGVGKSSLLNDIQEGLKLETGVVSEKIGRGKHTTRHSELIRLHEGGFIVDTPGFTSLEVDFIDRYELASCFPDFYYKGIDACRFHNCLHLNEPGCMVKEGVQEGAIAKSRYESYKQFIEACTEKENRRY